MGLIIEYIEITLNPRNIQHYENLGYDIPKVKNKKGMYVTPRGTKIVIRSSDLMKGSTTIVNVQCDCCKEMLSIPFYVYTHSNYNGFYYCNNCYLKTIGSEDNGINNYRVYIYENIINHKKYIGITSLSLQTRSGYNGNGYKKCTYFWNAIKKYGFNNFRRTIIKDNLTKHEACRLEIELIEKYKTRDNSFGYNILIGGNTGRSGLSYTEEEKLKRSGANSYNSKRVICTTTNKVYDCMTTAGIECGTDCSNISRACKTGTAAGHLNGEPLFWAYLGENGKYTQVKHIYPKRTREVICTTTNKYFDSMKEAAKYYNINPNCIYQCCAGRNQSGGKLPDGTKLCWEYV